MAEAEPRPERVCPECGRRPDEHRAPRRWPRWHVLIVQLGGLLLGLAFIGWMNLERWPALPPPATYYGPDVVTSTDLPARAFTGEDVERIAAGREHADLLEGTLEDLRDPSLARFEITACFGPPSAQVADFQRIGWPIAWEVHRYDATYADGYARAGPIPPGWRMPVGWSGWIDRTHFTHTLDAGRRHVRMIIPEAFLGVLVLLVLAAELGLALARPVRRRARRIARVLPWALAACVLLAVALLSWRPERTGMRLPSPWLPQTFRTGVRIADLQDPQAQQRLARAILDAVGDRRDGVLIVGWRADYQASQTSSGAGWPRMHVTRVEFPFATGGRPLDVQVDSSYLTLGTRRLTAGGTTSMSYTVRLIVIAEVILGLWALWKLPLVLRWSTHQLVHGRAERRLRRGLCVHCGYDVGGLSRGGTMPATNSR